MQFSSRIARTLVTLCLASAAPLAAAGEVWTVAPAGADFTQIQPAVNTAADGDLILVKPGSYAQFAILDRSLTVAAQSPNTVQVSGVVRVANLAAGRQVTLIDLSATGNDQNALLIADNLGSVRVRGGTWHGTDLAAPWGPNSSAVRVLNSVDVSLRGMTMIGGKGKDAALFPLTGPSSGGWGLQAVESNLTVHHCTAEGGDGGGDYVEEGYDGGWGGNGIGHTGGFLHLVNTTASGGAGGKGGNESGVLFPSVGDGGKGGDGLALAGGAVFSVGPMHAELMALDASGGPGGAGGQGYFGPSGSPGAPGQASVLQGTATSNTLAGPVRRLLADGLWRADLPKSITFRGQPGDQVFLVLSSKPGFQWLPAKQGVLLLGGFPSLKYVGQLGPTGSLTRVFTPGPLAGGLEGKTLHLQAWMAQPGGGSTLTGPSPTALIQPWL